MASRSPLERRHRKTARLALYGSLILSVLLGVASTKLIGFALARAEILEPGSQDWADVEWEKDPAVKILQGYLQVDTNWQTGSEVDGAHYLAGILEEAGIKTHIELLEESNANLWAILEGEEPGAVVLHNHIDVEPIRLPDEWDYPPFSGHIEPPWIYGRGVFDMKSLAVAQLIAMLDLKKQGVRPRKSLIFLATGSEEVGSDLGTKWVLRRHPELVRRFDVVLSEGGIVEAVDRKQVKYWGVSFAQKQYAKLIACSPVRQRLLDLSRDIRGLEPWQPQPLILTDELRTMMAVYGATRTRDDLRRNLKAPQGLLTDFDSFRRMPKYVKAMLRNEAYTGLIVPTESGFEMTVNIHVLPGQDIEAARSDLVPDWMLWGLDWNLETEPAAMHGSPTDHPAFQTLVEGVRQRYPRATVGPYFLPWTATDSRFFRRAGIPAYGFSPFLILTPDTLSGNNPNERVALPGFKEGVQMYSELVEELVK